MRPLSRPDLVSIRNYGNSIVNGQKPAVPLTVWDATKALQWNQLIDDSGTTGEKYEYARAYLILAFGTYCSYCEMPIEANLAVEHMLPKVKFKTKKNQWANLLLACTNCNSTKGERQLCDVPNRKSNTDSGDLSYFPDRLVTFNLLATASPFTYTRQPNQDVVVNGTTNIAKDMIQLVGLNATSTDSKVSDRRNLYRNQAWDLADQAIGRLHDFYEKTTDPVLRDILHRQILATAVHSGFWSVWVTVFWNALNDPIWNAPLIDYHKKGNDGYDNLSLEKQLIKRLFYYGFPKLSLYFPGTNPAFLGT